MTIDAGDVLKSGVLEKVLDFVNRLAGPMADEVGMMLGDKMRVYRISNWVKTVQKTEQLLRKAGLSANAVPPRLFLPIMEASSIEENENLQDMWAGLLATASRDTDTVSPAFIETLKQLTPGEARSLHEAYRFAMSRAHSRTVAGVTVNPYEPSNGAFERLGLVSKEYALRNIPTGAEYEEFPPSGDPEIVFKFEFTKYAAAFMEACQGPKRGHPAAKSK